MSSDEPAVGDEPVIRVRGVSKYYRLYDRPTDRLKEFFVPWIARLSGQEPRHYGHEFHALDSVSFEVMRGETVGIIGRNGSGKSTLLQMICGTLSATTGEIETRGRVAALLELGAGFDPEYTGRENVFMNAAVLGLTRQQTEERFDEITAFADIGEFIDQPVKTYSSGMYVRLAFAVIAHVDADILVIDEALAVGDTFFVQKCMRFLRRFMENGTVLFVSHDTASVLSLCQRAIWLDQGRVLAEGKPKAIADQYLAGLFDSESAGGGGNVEYQANETSKPMAPTETMPRDMRQDWINDSNLRNDLEVFEFDPDAAGFGEGGARIEQVHFHDENGRRLRWIVGGEVVVLTIVAAVGETALARPIIGFYVRDRLGQSLFGDNTYIVYRNSPVPGAPGQTLKARFEFRMPMLPRGEYSVSAAIADGVQHDHVQHHWVHDALVFQSHSQSESHGLVGIPVQEIVLESHA